jgi:hypothetical protein
VSIIEGEIPGRPPGYSVHVGADVENIFLRHKRLGLMTDGDLLAVNSRIYRMDSANSPNLAAFKQAYLKFKRYFLAPVLVAEGGTKVLKPMLEMTILKRKIHFRYVNEIDDNDRDGVVLRKLQGRPGS